MFKLSKKDLKQVKHLKYHHIDPTVRRRCDILFLRHLGYSRIEVASIAGVHPDTVSDFIKKYKNKGLNSLVIISYNKPISSLDNYVEIIKQDLDKNPAQTIKQVAKKIEKLTGIKRSFGRIAKFVKKLGFKRLKAGHIPSKADPKKQKIFLKEEIKPKLKEAKKGKRIVLFIDSAHFVHSVFLGALWVLKRVFIPSASGRKRWNVLGAVNAINKELLTVCNDSYINAQTICELLKMISEKYQKIPITIFLDNAKYQKCPLVIDCAKNLKIELAFLPPYSPNLNLIERVWRYVKKSALYCKYYETFEDFKMGINNCLASINGESKEAMKTLLRTRFHIEKKKVNLAA